VNERASQPVMRCLVSVDVCLIGVARMLTGDMGNSMNKVGYGCDQVALVSLWRKQWSSSSTTDPLAPFGIVTLASGGSEGAGDHMAHMRWSQTGNFGALPSPAMPRTFLAQAYDIGDPWSANEGSPSLRRPNCSSVNPATSKFDPECIPIDKAAWAPEVRKIEPLLVNSSATPIFMGGTLSTHAKSLYNQTENTAWNSHCCSIAFLSLAEIQHCVVAQVSIRDLSMRSGGA
jgi:hypothetical protein